MSLSVPASRCNLRASLSLSLSWPTQPHVPWGQEFDQLGQRGYIAIGLVLQPPAAPAGRQVNGWLHCGHNWTPQPPTEADIKDAQIIRPSTGPLGTQASTQSHAGARRCVMKASLSLSLCWPQQP